MKFTRRNLAGIMIAGLLTLLLASVQVAQAQSITAEVTTTDAAKLRSGPGSTFTQLATIPFNTPLTAIGRNADTTWIEVNYNGTAGWVAAFLLRVTAGDLASLPVATGTTPPAAPPPNAPPPSAPAPAPPGSVTATNYNSINVRSGPGTTFSILGMLPANTTIVLTGRWTAQGIVWVRFAFGAQDGWTASFLLKITGDVNSLPDVQAAAVAAAAAIPRICATGAGVPQAAAYTPGPGIHPTLFFDFSGTPYSLGTGAPTNWAPGTVLGTQLVGCVGQQQSGCKQNLSVKEWTKSLKSGKAELLT
jgi:uncharacterized protein YraI